jgi:hypothetical protein
MRARGPPSSDHGGYWLVERGRPEGRVTTVTRPDQVGWTHSPVAAKRSSVAAYGGRSSRCAATHSSE